MVGCGIFFFAIRSYNIFWPSGTMRWAGGIEGGLKLTNFIAEIDTLDHQEFSQSALWYFSTFVCCYLSPIP